MNNSVDRGTKGRVRLHIRLPGVLVGVMMLSLWIPPVWATQDRWETVNRKIFAFNETLDRYLLKPVAKTYGKVMPGPLQRGVGNVFSNIGEVGVIVNGVLQAKFVQAGQDTARLVVNSTVGIVGLFDVATKWGLEKHDEDFGQTLGYWGVYSGPFVMLPFFGPSTVRDGFGRVPDKMIDPVGDIEHVRTRNTVAGVRIIDEREALLEAEEFIVGDRYTFIRDAYLQRREYLTRDGEVEDEFLDDDWEDENW